MTRALPDLERAVAASVPADAALLLLAVSGGADSIALMHAAARWARGAARHTPAVATVDHGLRAGSREEAEGVAAAAASLGLPHHILSWTGRPSGLASQQAARRARYGLLADLARSLGADALLTAHTRDDQAETVLMRMAAGSGPAGLAGMAAAGRREDGLLHLRPFLEIAKADLVAACHREGWALAEDPSNHDPRFERVRWRRLGPALAAEGLDANRLAALAARLRRWDEALDAAAEAASLRCLARTGDGHFTLDLTCLLGEPDEVAIRVLAGAVTTAGPAVRPRLERLEACMAALRSAARQERPLRRTLAGFVLSLDRYGRVSGAPEGPRRRGLSDAVTVQAAEVSHSLGIAAPRA